ncbi:hypothetical protein NEOLEDRAFT_1142835 [Neolentinus lepideus HHB14362 ss-1]|uniref:Fungal-type protein kinase domain-containing protein n=1 Tax=Neolentinus lepideus HHB14362 ss-1 TaxID=1314782 RepID=A0A165MVY0_9AGAM|nr:hypothetical protein NEOLEDRAFT_1142835 [Neolentinus lepideus HHB14362 ss-1]
MYSSANSTLHYSCEVLAKGLTSNPLRARKTSQDHLISDGLPPAIRVTPLYRVRSACELLDAFLDATVGHEQLCNTSAHRGETEVNIIILCANSKAEHRSEGFLIDPDHSALMNNSASTSDPQDIVVTIRFLSVKYLTAKWCKHVPHHDLESIYWLLLHTYTEPDHLSFRSLERLWEDALFVHGDIRRHSREGPPSSDDVRARTWPSRRSDVDILGKKRHWHPKIGL